MTVEISNEAYRVLERRVREGHYASVVEALDGSIHQADAMLQDPFDPDFAAYVHDAIEEGLADVQAGRVTDGETFLADLRARNQQR